MARLRLAMALTVATLLPACAAASRPTASAAPTHIEAEPRIVTPGEVTTQRELAARAERALMEQRWADAADAYGTLVAADPGGPHAVQYAFNLGLAYEGLQERAKARDAFVDVAQRFPDGPTARPALVRAATLDAYLEDWPALAAIGDALLSRADIEDLERIVGLGARGLARLELGDDKSASADVLDGLDLSDRLHYGARDVLPVAIAQLRFALGELRRVRSERVQLDPPPPDFVEKLEARCGGLLEAQAAYAMAVQSIDPHWAAMAGYRVGSMYRTLHRELMQISPPPTSKTPRQKQIFYAFMHMRYRILLEKGLREMEQTIALGERTADSSSWIERARQELDEMKAALREEKARLEKMPFREDDVKEALTQLTKRGVANAPPASSSKSDSAKNGSEAPRGLH